MGHELRMVLLAVWLAVSGALSEVSINGSGRGVGFVWQGALLRPCTSLKTAACPTHCAHQSLSDCHRAVFPIHSPVYISDCWAAAKGASGLRKNVQQSPVAVRAHWHASDASGHAHEHGPDGEHTESFAGPGDSPDTVSLYKVSPYTAKVRHDVMLAMNTAAEANRSADTHKDCGHKHSGHSHSRGCAPSIGHTHEAGAAAACQTTDCGHDHGTGHAHSHAHSNSHLHSHTEVASPKEAPLRAGLSKTLGHIHDSAAAKDDCIECGKSHNHSHSSAPSKFKQAEAEEAVSKPPEISSVEMIQEMFGVFLGGQGGLATALGCICVLLATKLVKVSVPFFYQYVLDTLGTGAMSAPGWVASAIAGVASGQLGSTAIVLIVLYTVTKIVAQFMQSANEVVFSYAVQPSVRRAGRATVKQLFNMPLSFHTAANTGALTRSMERGMRAVTAVLSRILLHLFPQTVELLMVAVIVGMRAGVELAVVCVATVVVYGLFTVAAVNTRTKYLHLMNQADNKATSRLLDGLLHHEVVTAYNRQTHEATRYERAVEEYQKAQIHSQIALAGLNLGQKTIEALGAGYLLFKTATLVMAGGMSLGELIMINALLLQLMGPLDHLGANYMQLNQGLVDAREMFSILKSDSIHAFNPDQKEDAAAEGLRNGGGERRQRDVLPQLVVTEGRAMEIQFKDVHFGYGEVVSGMKAAAVDGGGHTHSSKDDERMNPILCGFDLTVERGTTVAIVGESGCGKSTVTRLLTCAISASSGQVLLDGQNVEGVEAASVRAVVALVQQDASLFNEDLAYNIAYGNLDASDNELRAAASHAQLDAVTEELVDGLATQVGDRGSRLSGGQRQRVALARALGKNAPILLCDEATSALDVYTEGRVMKGLQEVRKGKTTIVIAHRLSTIIDADEIIVMDKGRVAERGSHAALLAQRGSRYAAMWAAQEREVVGEGGLSYKAVDPGPVPGSVEEMLFEDGDTDSCGCGHAH